MNLHLIQDTVFLNDFADLLTEIGEIENNHFYVYYSESAVKGEFKHLKKNKFQNTSIIDCPLEGLHLEAMKYKNVFIHLLSDMLFNFVEKVDPKVKLVWCTWGSDFYGPDEIFTEMVFDDISAGKFREWNRQAIVGAVKKHKFPIDLKFPYRYIREEYRYHLHRKRAPAMYEKVMTDYLERKKKLLKKFPFHLNYGYEDHVFIKKFYEINPKFGSLFYTMFDETDDKIGSSSYFLKAGLKNEHKKVFIGNCATLHNNHLELIPELIRIKNFYPNVKFIVPLSYGEKHYSEYVSAQYKKHLSDSFFPIYEFIEKQEYYSILNSIDVMLMNHNVNMGGTNLFKAVYYGKKIFIKDKNPLGIHLRKNGVTMLAINDIQNHIDDLFTPLAPQVINDNKTAINSIFSRKKAAENIKEIFTLLESES